MNALAAQPESEQLDRLYEVESDDPSIELNAENEREFEVLAAKLESYRPTDLPDRFRTITRTMILPALTTVARRVRALGHDCRIETLVDEPMPAAGQAIYFTLDTRFAAGESSLCIRLFPGESVIRIESPGAGRVTTEHVPMPEFSADNVARVAIEFLKRAAV